MPHPDLHAFLILDQFSAQVIAAADPLRQDAPFVVIRQNADSHKCTVFACSEPALRLGIHPGDPLEMVRKKFPSIEVKERNEDLEHTAREELGRILESCTPEYHVAENGICWANLGGTPLEREFRISDFRFQIEESGESGQAEPVEALSRGAESVETGVSKQPLGPARGPQSAVKQYSKSSAVGAIHGIAHNTDNQATVQTRQSVFSSNDNGHSDCLINLEYQSIINNHLTNKIRHRLNIHHIAIGLGSSRIVARMMAHLALPDSIRICTAADEPRIIPALSVRLLPGLSFSARDRLKKYGIHTIGQLRELTRDALITRLGKEGEKAYCLAWGIDASTQTTGADLLWSEVVLDRDINDTQVLTRKVHYAVDQLCHQLKERGLVTDNLLVILRYSDGKSGQRTGRLSPTSDYQRLCDRGSRLFAEVYQRRVAIRSIRLIARRPSAETGQLSLFETDWERKQTLLSAGIERVREKMPFVSVMTASHLGR